MLGFVVEAGKVEGEVTPEEVLVLVVVGSVQPVVGGGYVVPESAPVVVGWVVPEVPGVSPG